MTLLFGAMRAMAGSASRADGGGVPVANISVKRWPCVAGSRLPPSVVRVRSRARISASSVPQTMWVTGVGEPPVRKIGSTVSWPAAVRWTIWRRLSPGRSVWISSAWPGVKLKPCPCTQRSVAPCGQHSWLSSNQYRLDCEVPNRSDLVMGRICESGADLVGHFGAVRCQCGQARSGIHHARGTDRALHHCGGTCCRQRFVVHQPSEADQRATLRRGG